MENCNLCNAKTSFERTDKSQPPEGQNCSICGEWVCNNCVEWSKCLQEPDNLDVICKECS
jgi:hypothetical protein